MLLNNVSAGPDTDPADLIGGSLIKIEAYLFCQMQMRLKHLLCRQAFSMTHSQNGHKYKNKNGHKYKNKTQVVPEFPFK